MWWLNLPTARGFAMNAPRNQTSNWSRGHQSTCATPNGTCNSPDLFKGPTGSVRELWTFYCKQHPPWNLLSATQGTGCQCPRPFAERRADVWGDDVTWVKWIHPRVSHESSPQMAFRNLISNRKPPLQSSSAACCSGTYLAFCHQLLFPLFVVKDPSAAWRVSSVPWATQAQEWSQREGPWNWAPRQTCTWSCCPSFMTVTVPLWFKSVWFGFSVTHTDSLPSKD